MPEPLSRMHRGPSSAISGRAKKWVGAGKGWVCCGQRRLTVAAASDAAPSHGRHRIWGARHQQAAPASLSLVALDPRPGAGRVPARPAKGLWSLRPARRGRGPRVARRRQAGRPACGGRKGAPLQKRSSHTHFSLRAGLFVVSGFRARKTPKRKRQKRRKKTTALECRKLKRVQLFT